MTDRKFETLEPIQQGEEDFDPSLEIKAAMASQLVALNAHLRILCHIQWAEINRPESQTPIATEVRAEIEHLFQVGLEAMTEGAEDQPDPSSQG